MHFREPLLIPCAAFAAGIIAAHYARFDSFELWLAMAAFASVLAVAHCFAPRCIPLTWACVLVVAGTATAEFHRPGPPPVVDALAGETLLVSGCVVEPLTVRDGRGRFALEIEHGSRANVSLPLARDVAAPDVRYGMRVEFPARVRSPRNFGNPGAFDYAGYLARRQTFWTATLAPRSTIEVLPGSCGSPFQSAVHALRTAALQRLDALYPNRPATAGLMRALLLGDDDRLSVETAEEFRKTGTYHALVISGLHISLIAGSILWLLRRAFAPVWLRLVTSAIAAWGYTLLAAGEAPVMRAAVGFTLALVAAAVHRKIRVLNVLAAVAMLFLAADPAQLFEPSFQLSFAAVAAIGALAAPIMERTSQVLASAARTIDFLRPSPSIGVAVASLRVELRLMADTISAMFRLPGSWTRRLVRASAGSLATVAEMAILSAAVQFALLVPSVMYFHRVPITSVVANLGAIPALNAAVGFGLTGLITGSEHIAGVAAWFAEFACAFIARFAELEPDWRSPTPAPIVACAAVLALVGLAVCLRRSARVALFAAIVPVGLGVWLYLYENRPGRTGWLEVSAIDVGQGDSLLVVFPEGQTMLIDGGGIPNFKGNPVRRMDIGEQVVSPYLWGRGLRKLDTVVLTHAHDDHAQGLAAVVRNFRPSEFWSGAIPTGATVPLLQQAAAYGARLEQPRAGQVRRFGPVAVRILAPAADYVSSAATRNNDSLVLEISYGRRRFILTGDAERSVETELVVREALRHADVLKVGHHGSKTSTTPDLLAAIRPTFAVVSVGDGNLYNHPHPDVIARLREFGVQAFRTDRAGLTQFQTDGKELRVETNWLNWRAD